MDKKQPLYLLKTMPGRIRFCFSEGKTKAPNLDAFLKIPGVEEATYNKLTKSLLLIYDEKVISKKSLFREIEKRFPNLELHLEPKGQPRAHSNVLSYLIYSTASDINRGVNRRFKGYADFTSIIPSVFLLWALEELIRNPVMPKWYDLLRFADAWFARHQEEYKGLERRK